jgi:hypothetical protein
MRRLPGVFLLRRTVNPSLFPFRACCSGRATGQQRGLTLPTRQCVTEGRRTGVVLGSGPDPPTRTGRDTGAPVVVIRLRPGSSSNIVRRHALVRLLTSKNVTRAISALGAGDVLLVTRLDRLARSTRDLLNVFDRIAKAGAGFRSLADQWCDTTTPHGRLMLTVLGGLGGV